MKLALKIYQQIFRLQLCFIEVNEYKWCGNASLRKQEHAGGEMQPLL